MSTIRLSCPHCETDLELDAAFAGAVARCGQCQAMISIPAEPTPRDHNALPPTQPSARRRSTPWLIAGVLTGLSAAIVVAVGVFVLLTHDDPNRIDAGQAMVDTLGYDPSVNPFTVDTPNALGVPLRRGAVVVIDSSNSARDWFDVVGKHAVLQQDDDLSVVIAQETRSNVRDSRSLLMQASGLADAVQAAEQVVALQPSMIVWITSEPMDYKATDIVKALDKPISVIHIDRADATARSMAEDTGGTYIELDSAQILDWHRAATR
ncbi:MAG: hypothetical protein AAGB29_05835 [Planctomycetota bacterium]